MTNSTIPDYGASPSPELQALVPFDGRRRPVKVVEHPAFRRYRSRADVAAPFSPLRVPVVLLNGSVTSAACPCRDARSTIATTPQEAA